MSAPAPAVGGAAGGSGGDKRPPAAAPSSSPAHKKRKLLPRGSEREPEQWCLQCVRRARDAASKGNNGYQCFNQRGAGARCVACAQGNHGCTSLRYNAAEALPDALLFEGQERVDALNQVLRLQAAAPAQRTAAAAVVGGRTDRDDETVALLRRGVVALERIADRLCGSAALAQRERDDDDEDDGE